MIVEKTYVCQIVGSGTREDPRRPRLADLPFEKSWFMQELDKDWCLISIVAEEEDHKQLTLETEEVVLASKLQLSLELTSLQAKFPKLAEKWEAVRKCTVTFQQKSGREEK
jgi:hypothetical protein